MLNKILNYTSPCTSNIKKIEGENVRLPWDHPNTLYLPILIFDSKWAFEKTVLQKKCNYSQRIEK